MVFKNDFKKRRYTIRETKKNALVMFYIHLLNKDYFLGSKYLLSRHLSNICYPDICQICYPDTFQISVIQTSVKSVIRTPVKYLLSRHLSNICYPDTYQISVIWTPVKWAFYLGSLCWIMKELPVCLFICFFLNIFMHPPAYHYSNAVLIDFKLNRFGVGVYKYFIFVCSYYCCDIIRFVFFN